MLNHKTNTVTRIVGREDSEAARPGEFKIHLELFATPLSYYRGIHASSWVDQAILSRRPALATEEFAQLHSPTRLRQAAGSAMASVILRFIQQARANLSYSPIRRKDWREYYGRSRIRFDKDLIPGKNPSKNTCGIPYGIML